MIINTQSNDGSNISAWQFMQEISSLQNSRGVQHIFELKGNSGPLVKAEKEEALQALQNVIDNDKTQLTVCVTTYYIDGYGEILGKNNQHEAEFGQ